MIAPNDSPLVFSLVNNPCIHDARVLKQAKSLVEAGYRVKVFAKSSPAEKNIEIIDGFEICRFSSDDSRIGYGSHNKHIKELFGVDQNKVIDSYKLYTALTEVNESLMAICELLAPEPITLEPITLKSLPPTLLSRIVKESGLNRFKAVNRLVNFITINSRDNNAIYQVLRDHYRVLRDRYRVLRDYYNACHKTSWKGVKLLRENIKSLKVVTGDAYFYSIYYMYAANLLALDFDQPPDVIHAHDLYTLPAAVALKNITGAKLIYDAHELEVERAPPLPPREKMFIRSLETKLLQHTDAMVTVSHSIAKIYEQKGVLTRTPTVVMNAPEMSYKQRKKKPIDIRDSAGLSKETPLIVYTGGASKEQRGMDKVVKALALLPDFHLVMIGPYDSNNEQWLLDIARSTHVINQVHFLPPVKHSDVVETIASADVGIIAIQDVTLSYRYALPNKLFEMAFAGLPLCVSDLPELRRFITDNNCGVTMDQTNPASIAKAIQAVYNERSKFTPEENELASIIGTYEWKQQALKLTTLYTDVLRTTDR